IMHEVRRGIVPRSADSLQGGHELIEKVRDGPKRASVVRFLLRLRDPVERLARNAVLSQKETQLGRVFLDVAQGVQLELEKAHRLPPPPGESHLALRLLV